MARRRAVAPLAAVGWALLLLASGALAQDQVEAPSLALTPAEQRWIAEHPVIRIQMSDSSPPFEFREGGQWQGLAYDYLLEAARRLGLRVEVTGLSWNEALAGIQRQGPVDLLLAVTRSPERERQMLLTEPYLRFPNVIVAASRHPFFSDLGSLKDQAIAVERGYVMEKWLRRDLPEARYLVVDSTLAALRQVATGAADVYVGNLAVVSYLIDKHGLANLAIAAPARYPDDEYAMGVRADWPELAALLNKALASLSHDDVSAIRNRWLSIRYEHGLRVYDVLKWAGLIALIALVVILQLRLRIARRTGQLEESERRFRIMAESVSDIVWMVDLAGNYQYVSPSVTKVRGVAVAEVMGGNAFDSLTEETRRKVKALLRTELARDGQPGVDPERSLVLEIQQHHADGHLLWLEARVRLIRDQTGHPVALLGVSRDISERKLAEQKLHDSQLQLANAAEIARLGPWMLDVEQGLFTFNDAFYAVYRTTAEREGGYTMPLDEYARRFVHPDDAHLVASETRLAIETGDPDFSRQLEHRILYADGRTGHISVRYFIVKDEAGRTIRTFGVNQDITEQRAAELSLKESEQRFRTLAESASDVIWMMDLSGRFQYLSPSVEAMRGMPAAEVLNENAFDLLTGESRQLAESTLRWELARDGEPGDAPDRTLILELQQRRKDGRLVWTDLRARFMRDSRGAPIGLLGITRDITEQKKTAGALAESERRFRMVFEAVNDAVFIMDGDLIVECNSKTLSIFGGSAKSEIIGRSPIDLSPSEQETGSSRQQAQDRIRRALAGEAQVFRWLHRKLSGEAFPADVSLSRVELEGKHYLIAVVRDMTYQVRALEERQRLERQMRQAQKMEALGVLAGGIAHDFNNILFAIQAYSDLALECVPPESKVAEYLNQSMTAGERAAALVRQILTFARSSERQLTAVNVILLAKEVSKLMRSTLPSGIEVSSRILTPEATVLADAAGIHQVLMNLCTNAGYAMRGTGGRLEVLVEAVVLAEGAPRELAGLSPGQYVRISVADTGPGIEPEVIERIFDPFFTTKPIGEGTGMGLATVQGIVAELGGAITVQSEPGQGSRFDVYLPQSPILPDDGLPGVQELPGGQERLMVIDDEPALAEMMKIILARLGYSVAAFTKGSEGLAAFEQQPQDTDLVITDQTMPGMTGSQLAERMLAIRPDLPVILYTGFSQSMTEKQALELGICRYLTKPLSREMIATAVRQAIDAKSRRQERAQHGEQG